MHLTCDGPDSHWSDARETVRNIQVLFADNHPLTLSGLKSAVASQADIHVLAECADRDRLSDSVRSQTPHILFVSSEFLQDELQDLTQLVSENERTRIILLTSRNDPQFFEDALRCGASGIFERDRPIEYIPLAIRRVMDGGFWFERVLAERMFEDVLCRQQRPPHPEESKNAALTGRERQVLESICEGMKNKEIALRMRVSEATVSRHVRSIFRKFKVNDRTSLVIHAVKKHMVAL